MSKFEYPVLIRRPELRERIPLSDTRVWELEKAGKFPKRIRLSANVVAWDLALVNAWIEERRAEGAAQAMPAPDVRLRKWRPVRDALPTEEAPPSAESQTKKGRA